jgi:23S rRNA (cytosine1962-C5)-methyltransferase
MSHIKGIVTLNAGKEQSPLRFHPWIFSGAIKSKPVDIAEGDIVEVQDARGVFLGLGHYQNGTIAVRLFSFKKAEPDGKFWKNKLVRAYNLRKKMGLAESSQTNVYRLIYAEGDGMPGLIIDYYNGTAVLQTHSIGMHLIKNDLIQALQDIYGDQLKAVYDKSEETMPKQSAVKALNGCLWGQTESREVQENGHTFFVDWEAGQKTGFFVDQRENRELQQGQNRTQYLLLFRRVQYICSPCRSKRSAFG